MAPGVEAFDRDVVGPEFGHLGADAADLPRRLGLPVRGPGGALGHVQVDAVAAPDTMTFSFSLMTFGLQPELAAVRIPWRGEAGGQQNGGDRVLSEHGMSLLLPGPRSAQAGWMLALWRNRFCGSYVALIAASRWYLAGP